MKKNSLIITILVAIIVGGVGFVGGMQYQKMQRPSLGNGQFAGRAGAGGRFGGQGAANAPVIGQVISKDSNSITVKLRDGSSKIVILSASTSINKQASGSASDLVSGTNVLVVGAANSDGSVTASNIQLNPMMRGFGGPSTSPSPASK